MQLLSSPASPFVRKVLVLAREAGVADRIQVIEAKTTPVATASEVAAANPIGKIPTLIRDDGPAIFDSRVICRYLDAIAGAGLYPESRLWETLTVEALADGMTEAAVLMIYEQRFRDEDKRSESWLAGQRDKIVRALDALEDPWRSHLTGKVTAAQIAVAAGLGYLDFRHPNLEWRLGRSELASWYARFAERPSMTATAPMG